MEFTIERLFEIHRKLVKSTSDHFVRSLIDDINWNSRLIGIKGSRGVGKTTLLLQFIKKTFPEHSKKALYVSVDSLYFSGNSILDLADGFSKLGGEYLFLDEVHKYQNWSQELKNICDSFPELNVVFTGSSLLDILNSRADLSRRAVVYHLQGLSFKEYLEFTTKQHFELYSLDEILQNHEKIAFEITEKVKPLQFFGDYLKNGYYPFYFEQPDLYYLKIKEVINMILEIELPLLRSVDIGYVSRLKQLLFIIAQSVPFVPNASKLSEKIGIQRATLLTYFHYLDEVNLTKNIFKEGGGISKLQKPQKIYLENTNLMYAITIENVNQGNLRETFFANQVAYKHQLQYSEKADFLVDDKYTFEIGGVNKGKKQILNADNAFVVADNIEYGFENKIPLWLFGFMY